MNNFIPKFENQSWIFKIDEFSITWIIGVFFHNEIMSLIGFAWSIYVHYQWKRSLNQCNTFVTIARALLAYLNRILAAPYPIGWHGIFGSTTELVPFPFSLYAVSKNKYSYLSLVHRILLYIVIVQLNFN